MDVVCVIYLSKFAIGQPVQQWGQKADMGKTTNKLESTKTTGISIRVNQNLHLSLTTPNF